VLRVFLVSLLLVACGSPTTAAPGRAPPLRIAAASSLTEVVPRIGAVLGVPVEAHFEASSTLARQIEAGDEADVFLSADERWADAIVDAGLADAADRAPFARNRLVIVTSGGRPLASIGALAALTHVAVAAEEVPAGRLARAALAHAGVLDALTPRLVSAPNVRGALAWVARGEAEAAIVFATDARVEPSVSVALAIPDDAYPPAIDVAVALHGPAQERARAFVAGLADPRVRAVLDEAGFGAAP
jgi:molybdate transport system substrate-binding protein